MSAYLCSKSHFVYLVAAATSARILRNYGPLSWNKYGDEDRATLPQGDFERSAEVANMLVRENLASLAYRYPEDKTSATLPGPNESFSITERDFENAGGIEIDPVQLLKSIKCLEYQSCEHPGWKTSEAHAFCKRLESAAINSLTGYSKAVWGAPEIPRSGAVLLSTLVRR